MAAAFTVQVERGEMDGQELYLTAHKAEYRRVIRETEVRKNDTLHQLLLLRYCFQIANALHHLHEAGYVYRDLKSDNVLLMRQEKCRALFSGQTSGWQPCWMRMA
ncbi:hypothetical protein BGW39_005115 [Mortierella sp. 14UC]|nr:hypothetical protein BGW39_005115 [Mortierella sp. 14UC]